MISPLQIERLLKHCENVNENYEKLGMAGDEGPMYFDYIRNQGWCEALRIVLERNGPSEINDKEMYDDS